ncbi:MULTISPECIES: hypothetical protein [unclassified Myroides]|uniref:hypothetical protein n=1 Tax=unclassified Myroides TaxID=2642485 RepID=UPI003D2F7E91
MTQEEKRIIERDVAEKTRREMNYRHIVLKLTIKAYKHELKNGGKIHSPAELIKKADEYSEYILGTSQEEIQE